MANPYTFNGNKITTYKDGSTPADGTPAQGTIFENEYARLYIDANYLKYEADLIRTEFDVLILGAPGNLNTLAKIASAIGDDPAFSTNVVAKGGGLASVMTGALTAPTIYGAYNVANGDITIEGTSHATKDTSYVILQPTGGNVAIGDTTAATRLKIVDTASTSIGSRGVVLSNGSTGDYLNIWNYAANQYAIESADGTTYRDLLLQPHGGNVGIGHAVASVKLDVNGALKIAGALSGITTLSMSGAITGATATNTINGLIINSGALSGITTLSLSGILTSTNTTDGGSDAGAIVTSGGIYAAKKIYSADGITGNSALGNAIYGLTTTGGGLVGTASKAGYGVYAVADAVGGIAAYVKSTSGTALSVVGTSTFSKDATINGLTVGKGGGNIATNTAYGASSLVGNVGGVYNSAFGGASQANGTSASNNTSFGYASLYSNEGGHNNVAIGADAGRYFSTSTALTTVDNSVFIGYYTRASANGNTNEIVIGHNVLGNGSNSVTLGNTSITKTILRGNVGIGTTDPVHKLTVAGGTLGLTRLVDGSTTSPSDDKLVEVLDTTGSTTGCGIYFQNSFQHNYATWMNFKVHGQISGVVNTAMTLLHNGNVGIGTTSPYSKMEIRADSPGGVGGTLRISNTGNTEGSSTALLMGYPHVTNNYGIRLLQVGNPSALTSSDFHIQQAHTLTTWVTRLFIQRLTGNVAIGSTDPGTYRLHVTGNIYATGTITAGSARALKENIVVSTINATEIIMKTDIMKFNYIADEKKEERIGFIADDTHEILAGTEHNKIDLTNSIGVLIKALQESNKRIELLEEKIRRNEVLR
jgi:hypothetical protein